MIRSTRNGDTHKERVHDRNFKRPKKGLALATDNGDEEERSEIKLKEVLKTDVGVEEAPDPFVEGNETALSVNTAPTTTATPYPTLMSSRPSPIGTVGAPNAQVAESTSETATATTSWESMAGSAVPGYSSLPRVGDYTSGGARGLVGEEYPGTADPAMHFHDVVAVAVPLVLSAISAFGALTVPSEGGLAVMSLGPGVAAAVGAVFAERAVSLLSTKGPGTSSTATSVFRASFSFT